MYGDLHKLAISTRVWNLLQQEGITTIEDAAKLTEKRARSITNFGKGSWQNLQDALRDHSAVTKPSA